MKTNEMAITLLSFLLDRSGHPPRQQSEADRPDPELAARTEVIF